MRAIPILTVCMLLAAMRAEAKTDQMADPGSGTGGVTVTGVTQTTTYNPPVSDRTLVAPIDAAPTTQTENVAFEELGGDRCFMFSQLVEYRQNTIDNAVEEPLELVIDKDEDYRKLFDPNILRQSCANVDLSKVIINVDFSKKTVLGLWSSGGCGATGFERKVLRNDIQKLIIYSVAVIEHPMACLKWDPVESLNLIAIPKVPAGYKVVFRNESEGGGTGGGTGGITVTSVTQTPTYRAPDLTVTAINGVPINQALPASSKQPTQEQEIVNDPADYQGLMRVANYAASTAEDVEAELKKGADVNKQDKGGNTALMFSVMYGFGMPGTVNALLSHGARVNMQSNNGTTALMLAAGSNGGAGIDIVNMLLEHGADPNIRNAYGTTALMDAAIGAKDGENVVRTLLQHGADPNIKTDDGQTALTMASSPTYVREPNPKVIALLSAAMSPAKPAAAAAASNPTVSTPVPLSAMPPEERGPAYDAEMRNDLKMPPEWFACKTSDDCTLAAVPCGTNLAVGKVFKRRAEALTRGTPGVCLASSGYPSLAVCNNGQCGTVIQPLMPTGSNAAVPATPRSSEEQGHNYDIRMRNALKVQPEWFACITVDDCALARVECNTSLAVGKAFKDKVQALTCRWGESDGRCIASCLQGRSDTSTAMCKDGQCATVIQ